MGKLVTDWKCIEICTGKEVREEFSPFDMAVESTEFFEEIATSGSIDSGPMWLMLCWPYVFEHHSTLPFPHSSRICTFSRSSLK
jgi:hypothetical protein